MKSFTEAKQLVDAINLTKVQQRLQVVENLSQDESEDAIKSYRQFLILICMGHKNLTPPYHADKAWHAHILHTKDYAQDCMIMVGHFIHHTPDNDEQVVDHHRMIRMNNLLTETFGDNISKCKSKCSHICRWCE